MNRHEILAIVLGGIVALGMAGGVVTSAAAASASDAPAEVDDGLVAAQDEENETETETEAEQDGEQNETTEQDGQQNETVPITEALEAAAEETNGTVVGAELGSSGGGILGGDDEAQVYTVDSLLDDGTHIETEVNATNGSVTQSQEADDGFLEGIFGEDSVPEDPINLSAIYNATEAVELAQNETDQNGTVTQVNLATNDEGNLTYEVQMNVPDGEQTTVVIDAMQDGEGVIDVQGAQDGGEETGTETETETEEGGGDEGDGGDGDEGN